MSVGDIIFLVCLGYAVSGVVTAGVCHDALGFDNDESVLTALLWPVALLVCLPTLVVRVGKTGRKLYTRFRGTPAAKLAQAKVVKS